MREAKTKRNKSFRSSPIDISVSYALDSVDPRGVRLARAPESNRPHAVIRGMQVLTQEMNHLQTCLAMFPQETEQVLALDYHDLRILQHLGSHFVTAAGQQGAKSEQFTGSRRAKG